MTRSLAKRLWYDFLWVSSRLLAVVFFRIRVGNRQVVPREGGALVMSNHQSNFDPVLVGLACDRRLNYLARRSLFESAGLRRLIESLDAIPIDRDGSGLGGLKETLRRLKRGEMVLIFPEGTRTTDGHVARLKPGFCALARRAWPRSHKLPRPSTIRIEFGLPLWPAEIEMLDDTQLVAEVERRIRDCHRRASGL
jgi:1-acyl-sn-glycerol-3-phosphate acyltransferase